MKMPLNLTLSSHAPFGVTYDPTKESGLSNLAAILPTWKRYIRRVGGYWMGTGTLTGDKFQMLDLFLNGLGKILKESEGGAITWQGFLGRMELTLGGITYVRDWLDIANRVKSLYTRIGDNLLANGSAESWSTYAWTVIGGATVVRDTSWRTDRTYSVHITATGSNKGAWVQNHAVTAGHPVIPIVDGKAYDLTADVRIVSGKWKMEVLKSGGASLASATEQYTDPGDGSPNLKQMRCSIQDTNTWSGNVVIRFICTGASQIYIDNVIFQDAPVKADTGWQEDADSQAKYGQHWLVLLEGSLSDQAASSKVLTHVGNHAWARTVMPDQFGGSFPKEDQLAMTFYGDAYTLRQKYCSFTGSDQMDNILNKILLETEIVTAGKVDANTTFYQIDTRAPLNHWEIIQGILKAGDANGAPWSGGCYEDHKFYYKKLSTVPVYRYRAGGLLNISNTPVIPWEVKPDVVITDDMPTGPGQNDTVLDDPRVFVVDEVEFSVADYLAGGSGLTFTRMNDL